MAPHVTEQIFSHLDTKSLIAISRTSKILKSAADVSSDHAYRALRIRAPHTDPLEYARQVHYHEIPGVMLSSASRHGLTLPYIQKKYLNSMAMPAPAPAYVNRDPNGHWITHPDRARVPELYFGQDPRALR